MKKNYIVLFLICWANGLFGQNYYYYYKNQQQNILLDKTGFDIYVNNSFQAENISNTNLESIVLDDSSTNQKTGVVEFINIPTTDALYFSKINELKAKENIISVYPRFRTPDGYILKLSNYAFVKLKNSEDVSILQNYANSKNFTIVGPNQFMPLWYKIECTKNTLGNPLEIANFLSETGYFAAANADFLSSSNEDSENLPEPLIINNPTNSNSSDNCSNDPEFSNLWGLKNSLNPGVDINVCNAWTITEGANIKVAVVDSGIDLANLDLSDNILLSYDAVSQTSPSKTYNKHGTLVGGIIGAIKDNNYQIVGVAPKAKLFSISSKLSIHDMVSIEQSADGINWAWQNGADVINNSWYVIFQSDFLENAISNALENGRNGLGTVVIFASGNSRKPINPNSFGVNYPANSDDRILVVGSIDHNGIRAFDSCYNGGKLDVVAPGVNVLTTTYNNGLLFDSGTSIAAPHVAGVCALVLSANPFLSAMQVNNIIEQTSKKVGGYAYTTIAGRPNGTWNNELGYGLVDAYEAVKMAQNMDSETLDLYIKDSPLDIGAEPNTVTEYFWASDDIWVRNVNDDGLEHQNPDYSANNNPNYVRVRVTNKSRKISTGNEQLKLYWAKAATSLNWSYYWDGSAYFYNTNTNQNVPLGGEIGTLNIPILQPGEETVLSLPWVIPNPADYENTSIAEPWHFCLLSRIVSDDDPMTASETFDVNANTKNNNNIAWKNVTVVDVLPNNVIGGTIAVGNPYNTPQSFYLELVKENFESGRSIYEEAEISIKMDDTLYNAWVSGGNDSDFLDASTVAKRKVVTGNNAILGNLLLGANERGMLSLSFNFLTKEMTEKTTYRYHVIQRESVTGKIVGGETYIINKRARLAFSANANDELAELNQPVTLTAEYINEPAVYNWYDSQGNLIHEGRYLQIANADAETYKLEVISLLDGFKDYTEVEVMLKPSELQTIAPNPANSSINVTYKLSGANSAYLIIVSQTGNNTTNTYTLDVNSTQTTINISNYLTGLYTIALIVNGEVVDAKTLIKQ